MLWLSMCVDLNNQWLWVCSFRLCSGTTHSALKIHKTKTRKHPFNELVKQCDKNRSFGMFNMKQNTGAQCYKQYLNMYATKQLNMSFLISSITHYVLPCKNFTFTPGSIVIFLGKGQESTVRIWFIWCSCSSSTFVAAVKLPVIEKHNKSRCRCAFSGAGDFSSSLWYLQQVSKVRNL